MSVADQIMYLLDIIVIKNCTRAFLPFIASLFHKIVYVVPLSQNPIRNSIGYSEVRLSFSLNSLEQRPLHKWVRRYFWYVTFCNNKNSVKWKKLITGNAWWINWKRMKHFYTENIKFQNIFIGLKSWKMKKIIIFNSSKCAMNKKNKKFKKKKNKKQNE